VTFLRGREDNQFQLDLWEFNLKDKIHPPPGRLQDTGAGREPVGRRKARRERERTASLKGILSYSWSPDGKQLLVPIAGNLYLIDVSKPDAARMVARAMCSIRKFRRRPLRFLRARPEPVRDRSEHGKEKQLTTDGKDTIHNGEAEFVAQEEMGQTTGYYWAPDDSAIAYKRYDEARCRSRAALKSLPTAPTWSSSATLPPAIRMCWSA
jgi:dipeptidyl-peptidase-4